MRYQQLDSLIKQHKPLSILEVGTWCGDRAIQMMSHGSLVYFGFDLFTSATPEDDEKEYNVKPHYSKTQVSERLGFPHKLYQGYSKYTLQMFLNDFGEHKVDFAFIDGGHSIETIQEDYDLVKQIVKPGGLIVFDDYYPDAPAEVLEKYGANQLLNTLDHTVLPMKDKVVDGFSVQLAYI